MAYAEAEEPSITLCSILADELVTARHPEHGNNVLLDLTTLGQKQPQKSEEVVWSIRTPLFGLLKKKPGVLDCPTEQQTIAFFGTFLRSVRG